MYIYLPFVIQFVLCIVSHKGSPSGSILCGDMGETVSLNMAQKLGEISVGLHPKFDVLKCCMTDNVTYHFNLLSL